MNYNISGENLPVLTLKLEAGEGIKSSSGALGWMNGAVRMSTDMDGGLFKGIGRMLAGESFFFCHYKSEKAGGILAIPSSLPGCIIPMELSEGSGIIAQKKAFMCAEESVGVAIAFTKKLSTGFFGGEGFILQRISGPGLAFFEIDGAVTEYVLAPGEVMRVDTGHIAMFEETVSYEIELVKGVKNMLFGGEGLFLAVLRGPGKIWLQSMPVAKLAALIIPFIPGTNT